MKILVTGSAGFIGFHLCRRLIGEGHEVLGYDGMTSYYDVSLKRRRHEQLMRSPAFKAIEASLEEERILRESAQSFEPHVIVHLAAQTGVRHGLEAPDAYISSNLVGTFNVLEVARQLELRHLLFASTSSTYGGNEKLPFEEADRTDFPISLYAATKKAGEAMSHAYSHLFKVPTTCFRFFTVYGPWGRPDMALFKFVDAIENNQPIEIYGDGRTKRDYTYIDDLIEGIVRLMSAVPVEGKQASAGNVRDSISTVAPWRVVNIGGGQSIELLDFIDAIERALKKPVRALYRPMQPGDVMETSADPELLKALTGFVPRTDIAVGVAAFVDWYREYYSGALN